MDEASRIKKLGELALHWIKRSELIKKLVDSKCIQLVTYEKFCENPSGFVDNLNLPNGIKHSINVDAEFKISDYEKGGILNHNERQIGMLNRKEIDNISLVLSKRNNLLSFYGYNII